MSLGKLIGLIAFTLSIYILWKIKRVILLGFMAIVFATAINQSLVRQLQKLGIKRGIAVTLSVIAILAVLAGFVALIVPSITDQWQDLVKLVPEGLEKLRGWYQWIQNFIPGNQLADFDQINSVPGLMERLPGSLSEWTDNLFTVFSSSLDVILNTILVIVVTIMFLANPSPYRRVFILLFPSFYRPRIDDILSQSEKALIGWLKGILFNMAVITIFSGIGLKLLGIPLALVNAILAGLLTFIPNLGPTLSVIPPAALGLLEAPWKAAAVIVLYIIIQQIESNILTPIVMQHQVSLLPAITLLSQVAFAIFFGFLGLFLALPILVVSQVWLREILVKDILNNWTKNNKKEDDKPERVANGRNGSDDCNNHQA